MAKAPVEPYVGPRPFQRIDEALFFGRDKEASELLSLIIANPILILYARSGAGKTSLINARLLPLLEKENAVTYPVARVQGHFPEGINFAEVRNANIYSFNALISWKKTDDPQALMGKTLADFLATTTRPASPDEQIRPRVIVFDQFEELFTFYPDHWKERLAFFRQVNDLLEGEPLLLNSDDLQDTAGIMKAFARREELVSSALWTRLSPQGQQLIEQQNGSSDAPNALVDELNKIIQGETIFDEKAFAQTELRVETKTLIREQPAGRAVQKLNRLLLEDAYAGQIRRRLDGDPLLRVVFSMREDYIAELDPYATVLPNRMRVRYRLEPLRRRAALSAVKGPLERTDLRFAPEVAEQLVENLLKIPVKTAAGVEEIPGEFVEPVQLQVVCQSLWEHVQSAGKKEITEEHLRTYGDVSKALRAFYERTIQSVVQSKKVKEWPLRRWFEEELITAAGTRGMVFRGADETSELSNDVVDDLERQHIIRAEVRGGERWYELSHDRFIQPIRESNNDWRLERSGAVSKRQELEKKALAWVRAGSGGVGLLDENLAVVAKRWIESPEAAEIGYSKELYAFVLYSRLAVTKAHRERDRAIFERETAQANAIAKKERERAEAEQARREEQERRAEAEKLRAEEQERRAKVEQLRAEEQERLAETQRKRAEEKAQSSARLRKLVAGMAVLFVLATGTAVFAFTQRLRAVRSEADARAETHRANQQAELAIANAKKAEDAVKVSESEKRNAEAFANAAVQERERAKQQEQLARAETKRANEQTRLAQQQKSKAEAAVLELEKQRQIVLDQNAALKKSQEELGQALEVANAERKIAAEQTAAAFKARNEAQDALEKLQKSINAVNEAKSADSLKTEAGTLERNRDYSAALEKYQQALTLYQKSNDKSGVSSVFEGIGRVQNYRGDIAASVKSYQEALSLLDPIDRPSRARILTSQGYNFNRLNIYDEALKNFQEALKISEAIHDNRGTYSALVGIGGTKANAGDNTGARDAFGDALQVAEELNDDFGRASTLSNLGFVSFKERKYERAVEYYLQALELYQKGKFPGQESVLNNLISIYTQLGDKNEADRYSKQLRAIQSLPKP